MIYLKLFEGFKSSIRYILAYLIDDDFNIIIHTTGTRPSIIITKKTTGTHLLSNLPCFNWSEVENDILRFIHSKGHILDTIEIIYKLDDKLEVKKIAVNDINEFYDDIIDIVRIQIHFKSDFNEHVLAFPVVFAKSVK
jgi:hypothetical protein